MGPTSILHKHEANWVYILGRVKPGTALAPLQAKMSADLRNWLALLPLYQREDQKRNLAQSHVVLTPGGVGIANMQQEYGKGLKFLMWISALVLLIACANIANLVLVRGLARRAETSIRMALGAQRKRLIRQMLTESVVLSCMGGVAGLIVAYAGTADGNTRLKGLELELVDVLVRGDGRVVGEEVSRGIEPLETVP